MSYQMLLTAEEAEKELKKRRGFKVNYHAFVNVFLPTADDPKLGYNTVCIVDITRGEMIKAIHSLLRNLGKRGAKVCLTIPEDRYESFSIGMAYNPREVK